MKFIFFCFIYKYPSLFSHLFFDDKYYLYIFSAEMTYGCWIYWLCCVPYLRMLWIELFVGPTKKLYFFGPAFLPLAIFSPMNFPSYSNSFIPVISIVPTVCSIIRDNNQLARVPHFYSHTGTTISSHESHIFIAILGQQSARTSPTFL